MTIAINETIAAGATVDFNFSSYFGYTANYATTNQQFGQSETIVWSPIVTSTPGDASDSPTSGSAVLNATGPDLKITAASGSSYVGDTFSIPFNFVIATPGVPSTTLSYSLNYTITGAASLPDLNFTSFGLNASSLAANGDIDISFTLANSGSANAGASQIGIYYSTSATFSKATATLLFDFGTGAIAADSSTIESTSFNLNNSIPPGDYYIYLYADDTDVVAESNENNNATSGEPLTITAPALFTTGADTVDFNNLTADQKAAIIAGADKYDGLGGNDVVTLPTEANETESIGDNETLGWHDSVNSLFHTGSLAGQTYTVNGTDGSYYVDCGAGTDLITINGSGSSTIVAGSGNDTISITGNGNNLITAGTGTPTINLDGYGNNKLQVQGGDPPAIYGNIVTNLNPNYANNGSFTFQFLLDASDSFDGTLSGDGEFIVEGGSLDMHGGSSFTGEVGILNATLELSSANAVGSGQITFLPDPGQLAGTLRIDGTTMPTNVINGFSIGTTIDLTDIVYKSSYETVFYETGDGGTLQIIDTAEANAAVATLTLLGSFSSETFGLGQDSGTGTVISVAAAPYAAVGPEDVLVTGVSGQAYSSYEELYNNGTFEGTDYFFTGVTGQAYSAYAYDYSPGNDFIGSKFDYTNVTGQAYTGYEYDYDGGGHATRVDFTGVAGTGYSSYEYDFNGGVFAGSKFEVTSVAQGASYSSYELDYNSAATFTGDRFFFTNVSGQSYTGLEEDFDASGKLAKALLSGVTGQSYSSLEEDYSAGTYTGYKATYTGITGQSYTTEEVDVSSANQITKVVYSGLSGTPYSSVEQDYSNGALADVIYDFTNVTGASAYAYQVEETPQGGVLQSTYDNNDGTHTIIGAAANQTFSSIANDTITGGGSGETFLFSSAYGHDTITDFSSHLTGTGHDTISLATSEFANFAAVLSAAQNVGNNVVITAPTGDTLTLDNISKTTLSANAADFSFHA